MREAQFHFALHLLQPGQEGPLTEAWSHIPFYDLISYQKECIALPYILIYIHIYIYIYIHKWN